MKDKKTRGVWVRLYYYIDISCINNSLFLKFLALTVFQNILIDGIMLKAVLKITILFGKLLSNYVYVRFSEMEL